MRATLSRGLNAIGLGSLGSVFMWTADREPSLVSDLSPNQTDHWWLSALWCSLVLAFQHPRPCSAFRGPSTDREAVLKKLSSKIPGDAASVHGSTAFAGLTWNDLDFFSVWEDDDGRKMVRTSVVWSFTKGLRSGCVGC